MFKTRTEVVAYLAAKGLNPVYAKIAIDQGYNFDRTADKQDLCRRYDVEEEVLNPTADNTGYEEDALAVLVSEADALLMYDTFNDMLDTTADGITVDGELLYDLQGNQL